MRLLAGMSLAVAVVSGALIATPASAATWSVVPSQAVGSGSILSGVDALSATDAWAAGGSGNGLVERWNGTRWAVVASPDLLDHSNPSSWATLNAVDAVSSTSAVAVGEGGGAVAERFNGTSWSRSTVANGATVALKDVKALSPTDAWAVGRTTPTFNGLTAARHFNGSTWAEVATPSPGTRDNWLLAVAGTSASDVWAVGWSRNLPYGNRTKQSLIVHWNGSGWSQVPSPNFGSQTVLKDVAALSRTDAWAVGYGNGTAVALHWNGSSWSAASAPPLGTLDAIAALSPTDLWASGTDAGGALRFANWRGSGWSVQAAPSAGGSGSPMLTGMAAVAPGTVWAVGSVWDGTNGTGTPLVMRTTNG